MTQCPCVDMNTFISCGRRRFTVAAVIFYFFWFSCLTSSLSLTLLMSKTSVLRLKERLMGELISSGFYMHNRIWLQTLSGSQANEQAD